jgi:hypothetical protein
MITLKRVYNNQSLLHIWHQYMMLVHLQTLLYDQMDYSMFSNMALAEKNFSSSILPCALTLGNTDS